MNIAPAASSKPALEPLRLLKFFQELFVGKTIASMNAQAVNVLRLNFTDGTSVELNIEYMGAGIYGIVLAK